MPGMPLSTRGATAVTSRKTCGAFPIPALRNFTFEFIEKKLTFKGLL